MLRTSTSYRAEGRGSVAGGAQRHSCRIRQKPIINIKRTGLLLPLLSCNEEEAMALRATGKRYGWPQATHLEIKELDEEDIMMALGHTRWLLLWWLHSCSSPQTRPNMFRKL
ncbi:hypothetical protein E2C01_046647 [Portunus trituberculatus]|uniref:Uncharacterized protein n=1 Tax=Portunus trituberculatus TaxID=210409 RepID=A0A5B7FYD7_PORTR|nr:hypothetical protein [Portunus trituberculatus]